MFRALALTAALAFVVAPAFTPAFAADKDKPKGQKCGNSYIAANKTCHKDTVPKYMLNAGGKCMDATTKKFAKEAMCKKPGPAARG
jgi:hypothetical protein